MGDAFGGGSGGSGGSSGPMGGSGGSSGPMGVLVSLLVPWAALVAPVVQEEEVSWMPLAGVDLVREGFPLNTSCMYTLQAEDYTNQISNEENKTEYTYVEK